MLPKKWGEPWTPEAVWEAVERYARGDSWRDIANHLGRSEGGCKRIVYSIRLAYKNKEQIEKMIQLIKEHDEPKESKK